MENNLNNIINSLVSSIGSYRGIAVIGVEIVLVIMLFWVCHGISRVVIRRISPSRLIEKYQGRSTPLQRGVNWLIFLLAVLACISVASINGYYLYKGVDIYAYALKYLEEIPSDFWIGLGINIGKVLGLTLIAGLVIRILRRILFRLRDKAMAYERISSNDESVERFFSELNRIQKNSIWLFFLSVAAAMLGLPVTIEAWLHIILKIYLIVSIGLLISSALSAIVDSLDALSKRYARPGNWLAVYERMRVLVPVLRRTLEYIVYVIAASLILLQLGFVSEFAKYGPSLVEAIGIVFIARVVVELSDLLIDKTMVKGEEVSPMERQRELTLIPIIKNIVKYLLFFAAFVLVLRALNLNPLPLLAGAGILGVVIGLGAQPLINDILAGFFILFENLFLVGDFVEIGTARGVVESIHMRTTSIRDPDGQLHILRNGQIADVVNYSKGYANAVVEVGVAYESNLDHVYKVLGEAGNKLKETNINVLGVTSVEGLINFGESDLLIRTVTQVKPGTHGLVARHLRKLIKEAFDEEGIEIPFARRVVIFKKEE